jgi:ArsR family transcriptional regulator
MTRRLVAIFKALSDPNRLRIIKMLQNRDLCVCEINEILGLATSTTSKHLSILRHADLIIDSKDAKWVNYSINDRSKDVFIKALLPLLKLWLNDDENVQNDIKAVKKINRNAICCT